MCINFRTVILIWLIDDYVSFQMVSEYLLFYATSISTYNYSIATIHGFFLRNNNLVRGVAGVIRGKFLNFYGKEMHLPVHFMNLFHGLVTAFFYLRCIKQFSTNCMIKNWKMCKDTTVPNLKSLLQSMIYWSCLGVTGYKEPFTKKSFLEGLFLFSNCLIIKC